MNQSIKFSLIAACDRKMGIGKNGTLPWKLKNEMAYFTKMTVHVSSENKQNAVIMGLKSWQSIPPKYKPLAGRLNVVLSTSLKEKPEGALLFRSLDEAIEAIRNDYKNIEKLWIIGGSFVYKEAINHPSCDKLYLTEIDREYDCDVFFPQIPKDFVILTDHGDESELVPAEQQRENGVSYYYRIYKKQNKL